MPKLRPMSVKRCGNCSHSTSIYKKEIFLSHRCDNKESKHFGGFFLYIGMGSSMHPLGCNDHVQGSPEMEQYRE